MPSIRNAITDLVSVARKAENTLKSISRASASVTRLGTGAIYGCLGFSIGAGGAFAALVAGSALIYAPFAVPLAGLCGMLIGVLVGRDRIDRENERAADIVDQVWTLRDREVEGLAQQIKAAKRDNSPRLALLEQKLTFLELAPPERLREYYSLTNRRHLRTEQNAPVLGPDEQQILDAWRGPQAELQDLRD